MTVIFIQLLNLNYVCINLIMVNTIWGEVFSLILNKILEMTFTTYFHEYVKHNNNIMISYKSK